jgi:predicted ATPase
MGTFSRKRERVMPAVFDEPQSELSPNRQIEFLKLLRRMQQSRLCQVIMATHSPLLMAMPGASLIRLTPQGIAPIRIEATDHFRIMREFCADPQLFVEVMLDA